MYPMRTRSLRRSRIVAKEPCLKIVIEEKVCPNTETLPQAVSLRVNGSAALRRVEFVDNRQTHPRAVRPWWFRVF
jgi:hypothetical protein